ncbi:hypothetical protein NQ317_007872 [Molorchus minor]|uniref:Signal peptide peptidase-like 3 n=1 Tax=Molorchus minor TaxID=1323400 RepID=A0ABQ9J1P5_9CUCU|nr:hypothetical protein NQ317_007872 [Molorchus minor]
MADAQAQTIEYQWAYSIMDSSRVSTFLISMLLIVYGSFRSLNMEQEARERANGTTNCLLNPSQTVPQDNVQTLDTMQALCLPLGASISLLVMFFFFDSMQMLFAICTAIIATVALAFLLLPMCQYIIRPCSDGNKISFGVCGRFTAAELLSFSLSVFIVCIWVLTGHWLLMDAMGMGLCVAFIAFVRLPSLKVSTLLLTGLLIYDVFWVFFSSYIFSTNVMVKVRLGDIVMPGLLLCFVLRYDAYKKSQGLAGSRLTYFHCSLLGYFLGLLTATVSSEVFKAAQPALLYLVPFTLLPLLTMAYLKGDLRRMWSEPFKSLTVSKHLQHV